MSGFAAYGLDFRGGCVAGITAPRRRDDVRAMVQYYPAFCIPDGT